MSKSQPTTSLARPDIEERALLESIAAEDRDALTELYGRYHAKLFKFVFRLTRSYASADELVNDIMLAVWRSAAKFRGDSKPSTWIFGIAYRQALKRLSRKQLTIAANFDVDQLPDRESKAVELEDWVRQGLATLPAAQRLAVELVFFLGLSYEEVAAVTECPVNTVKTRMFHARRKLKEQLLSSASGENAFGEIE
jgi:RNA polymerase sigma-70 factor (ECF subfamily)